MAATFPTLESEVRKAIDQHNKDHNPSGVPYKGEKKRTAPEGKEEEEKSAVTLECVDTTVSKLSPDATLPGPQGHYELLVKPPHLYLHALNDCIVSAQTPVCHFWGRYLCGSTDKKDIAKFQDQILPWQMDNTDFQACFSVEDASGKEGLKDFPEDAQPLIAFLRHLEGHSLVGVNIEVHEVKYTQMPDALQPGQMTTEYSIKPTEECYFLPQPLPKNTKILMENAASVVEKGDFDWTTGRHSKDHLQMFLNLEFHPARNTILPRRPKLFLTKPVKLTKGKIAQLT